LSYSVIYLLTIFKIDGNLTKFLPKQFVQVFFRHGVYILHQVWIKIGIDLNMHGLE